MDCDSTHTVPGNRNTAPVTVKKSYIQITAIKLACIKIFTEIHDEPRTAYHSDRKIQNVTAKQLDHEINVYGAIQD